PASGALLRREIRDPRVYRLAALRVDTRPLQRGADNGADARAQHAAIHLGAQQDRLAAAAGTADLPARGRGAGNLFCGAFRAPRGLGRLALGAGDPGPAAGAGLARPLPRALRLRVADVARAG